MGFAHNAPLKKMLLQPQLRNPTVSQDEINKVLGKIDYKLYQIAYTHLNNVRFGFSWKVNRQLFKDLNNYKEVIIYKLMGPNLDAYEWLPIISKVNNLINS